MSHICSTLGAYCFLLSEIAFNITTYSSTYTFDHDLLFHTCNHNYYWWFFSFGFGGSVVFIFIFAFFASTDNIFHYVFTLPLYIFLLIYSLYLTSENSYSECLVELSNQWKSTNLYNFDHSKYQLNFQCCGWENYSDNGILKCPFSFESGCKNIFNSYFEPQFTSLFSTFLYISILSVSSFILLMVCYCFDTDSNISSQVIFLN